MRDPPNLQILAGLKNIAQLIKMAKNRVTILAGGGVNHNNISKLYETTLQGSWRFL